MKKIIILFALMIGVNCAKAQWVTIPDANLVTWLQNHYPTCMSGNQLNTVCAGAVTDTMLDFQYWNSNYQIVNYSGVEYFTNVSTMKCDDTPGATYTTINLSSFPPNLHYLYIGSADIDTLGTLPTGLLYLDCSNNTIYNLPSLPLGLKYLDCSFCNLTSVPTLPANLTSLNCSANYYIGSLPTLPSTLTTLSCFNEGLTSLPALPSSLISLICAGNPLTGLSSLPTNLSNLDCSSCTLTSLPSLPISLTNLNCKYNPFTSTPVLPANLTDLDCSYIPFSSFPALPNGLINLTCRQITGLNLAGLLPSSLITLNCDGNVNLDLANSLPSSLQTLYCSFTSNLNLVNALPSSLITLNCNSSGHINLPPSFPSSLINLYLVDDTLTSITSLPPNLQSLDCSYSYNSYIGGTGQLTSLPTLPSSLLELNCSNNLLTSLPSIPSNLQGLSCKGNLLTTLPVLPTFMSGLEASYNNISCLPFLPEVPNDIFLQGNPISCVPNYPLYTFILGDLPSYPICTPGDMIHNPNGCTGTPVVKGYTYTDNNSDCNYNAGDVGKPNISLMLYDNNSMMLVNQTYSLNDGYYNFPVQAGSYTIVLDTTGMPYTFQCVNPGIDSVVNPNPSDSAYFDIICDGYDLGIQSAYQSGWVFPGQQHTLHINAGDLSHWYGMNCAGGMGGTLSITVGGPVAYVGPASGALSPSVSGNTYTYNIADFGTINNSTAFNLLFNTNTTALSGDTVCVTATITSSSATETYTANNSTHYCYVVHNSFDPNLKETYPVDVDPGFADYFTYTIHFQNTGTAQAFNINVLDTLSTSLDLSTFQLMNYSHPVNVSLQGNVLTAIFSNILLADSTSNEAASHGFIQYRIKPLANLPGGTQIYNTAGIYFDFNAPVRTNTTVNNYRLLTNISSTGNHQPAITISPNPASSVFTITSAEKIKEIKMRNVLGKAITPTLSKGASGETSIDISSFAKGIYFVEVFTENGRVNGKVVKE